ncbi:MAG: OadG family protein [Candidatus Cloacimonadia bacterium]
MIKNKLSPLFGFLGSWLFISLFTCRAEAAESAARTVSATNTTPLDIVITGIVVVFISLSIVTAIISLFKYFAKPSSKKNEIQKNTKKAIHNRITSVTGGTKYASQSVDQEVLSAIITTIFLYESEVENQSRVLLTMQRAKISSWKQSAKFFMPNLVYRKKG